MSVLWAVFILNDLAKLLNECYKETRDLLKERRQRKDTEIKVVEQVTIQLEDEKFSRDLEGKLEQIHLQLVKACYASKKGKNTKK